MREIQIQIQIYESPALKILWPMQITISLNEGDFLQSWVEKLLAWPGIKPLT